jgi:hypothetical protein
VRRSSGKVRGRPRRRGRRGICASRWSPINYLPTERTAQNSARVASETAPSTWNIGCRVTRNVSAKVIHPVKKFDLDVKMTHVLATIWTIDAIFLFSPVGESHIELRRETEFTSERVNIHRQTGFSCRFPAFS